MEEKLWESFKVAATADDQEVPWDTIREFLEKKIGGVFQPKNIFKYLSEHVKLLFSASSAYLSLLIRTELTCFEKKWQ